MISWFAKILGIVMNFIYKICGNYFGAIIYFSIFAKIVLFPINILIQKNSIKMIKIKPKIEELKYKYADDKEKFMDEQIALFDKEKYKPSMGILPILIQIPIVLALVKVIEEPNNYISGLKIYEFLGINLGKNPTFSTYIIIPIIAAISCILLCFFQNKSNVLQKEESLKSKLFTGIITTALTTYFTFIVPCGVGIYWIMGNLLAIIQMYILNAIYPPRKYINYDELSYWQKLNKEKKAEIRENQKREKQDYKKFMNNIENIKLVFFSEQSGFYKYFAGIIEYLLKNSDLEIHYITNDPNDNIFNKNDNKLKPYYIGKNKTISLFMKLEAEMVVMTTPDLQKYYLKRSIVKKDIEYVYMDHGISSFNLSIRTGALDYYDTVFVCGPEQKKELNELKKIREMKLNNIIEVGSPIIDDLIVAYNNKHIETNKHPKTILIAPSYQEDNILESCIEPIINELKNCEYKVIIRPHPQFIKRKKEKINELLEKYKNDFNENFYFELDFSSNETIYSADLVITDWSAISFEFAFATTKPVLYINTKMKVVNKEYKKIPIIPMEIEIRNKIGKAIEKNDIKGIKLVIDELISHQEKYKANNISIRNQYMYNIENSGKAGAEYIINRLKFAK